MNEKDNNLIRILESTEYVIDYDIGRGMYRVSLFKNGHYKDEIWFDEVEKRQLNE